VEYFIHREEICTFPFVYWFVVRADTKNMAASQVDFDPWRVITTLAVSAIGIWVIQVGSSPLKQELR